MRIVHISDTHFGTEVAPVMEALIAAVNSLAVDMVILSGDITQRARPHQFQAASSFMNRLQAPVKLTVPGNHDIPLYNLFARFSAPYQHYKSAFKQRECIWHNNEIAVIALDTTSPFRHTDGKVSQKHAAFLRKTVANLPATNQLRVMVCHQPLQTAWPQDAGEVLIGADITAQLFAECGIDLFLSGHVHVPLCTTTATGFPNLIRPFVLAGAGTATSYRTRPGAPNSFNVIETASTATPATLTVSRYDYVDATQSFSKADPITFARQQNAGWC